jgi:hypothetical protein
LKGAQQSQQQVTARNETELNTTSNEEISTEDIINDADEHLKSYMSDENYE